LGDNVEDFLFFHMGACCSSKVRLV
jgi:hypothetical protein